MTQKKLQKNERPPVLINIMKTLNEINKRLDNIQQEVKTIKKITAFEKDFVIVNDE